MPALTDEEKRILELMKQFEARDAAQAPPTAPDAPPRAQPERFTTPLFFDDDGKPFPIEGELPSEEEQAASHRKLIATLEAKLGVAPAPAPVPAADGPPPDEKRRG